MADPVKQIASSRLLENRPFRFVQARLDRSHEFKSAGCERLAYRADGMRRRADLEGLAAIAEASPPAPCVAFRMKVRNKYVRAWPCHPRKLLPDRNEVVDVT